MVVAQLSSTHQLRGYLVTDITYISVVDREFQEDGTSVFVDPTSNFQFLYFLEQSGATSTKLYNISATSIYRNSTSVRIRTQVTRGTIRVLEWT